MQKRGKYLIGYEGARYTTTGAMREHNAEIVKQFMQLKNLKN